MDKLLVAGINTVVGANLAAWLANRFEVVGLSWGDPISIAGCETAVCDGESPEGAHHWIASERPQWVVYCGPAANSCWEEKTASRLRPQTVAVAGAWARAAEEFDCELTVVSSDAAFTGPWMFHRENGTCFCGSTPARIIRMIEKEVTDVCSNTLLVRTNVFGWAPTEATAGLVETVLSMLQDGQPLPLDCMRHGTPILATDFADVLERAYQQRLHGLFHLAGGERINPFRFACLLASQFGLSASTLVAMEASAEARRDFAGGETSLQTHRIRKVLEMPLPLIREGLSRLHEQDTSGYRDRFNVAPALIPEKVA